MGDLLLVTGDSSADRYAANLIEYLGDRDWSGDVYAAAGRRSETAGARLVDNVVDRGVVGLTEIAGSLPYFYNLLNDLDDLLDAANVEAVLLMDFPGFNLAFSWLSRVREMDVPLFYYITPQVWAWWRWRIRFLRDWFEELFVIFPFEEQLLREEGANARFVGHPMLENRSDEPDYDARETMDLSPGRQIISFFPGSRDHEVKQHLDVMAQSAERIQQTDDQYQPVFSAAPTVDQRRFRDTFDRHGVEFPVWGSDSRSLLEASELAVLASGTITMEATFAATPMIVGYRTSWLTWNIGQYLSHTDQVAMPNLIHGEPFVPELLQDEFTSDQLTSTALDYLSDRGKRDRMADTLRSIRSTFRQRSPSAEVGNRLLDALR